MTRARKRLILTWAKYRRRFGGGEQERSTPSCFLGEVPEKLILNLGPRDEPGEVDLHAERYDVRQSRQAQHLYRQDLQLAGQHFAVLRRARHAVQAGPAGSSRRSPRPRRRRSIRGPAAARQLRR